MEPREQIFTHNLTDAIIMNLTAGTSNTLIGSSAAAIDSGGGTGSPDDLDPFEVIEELRFPFKLRLIASCLCCALLLIGFVGNVLVPYVVSRTRDLRNSTNYFLVNLSLADLILLIVCPPTAVVELNSKPEVWTLGEFMCKAVSFIELLVAHSSVLTILVIGYERYYATCRPLDALVNCTPRRALKLIAIIWLMSLLSCVPMLYITELTTADYVDGSKVPTCVNSLNQTWSTAYYVTVFVIFFVIPFIILLAMFCTMSRQLLKESALLESNQQRQHFQVRKQVVIMIAIVCITFFICLFPFRLFTLWIIYTSPEDIRALGMENFYNLLYSCRVLLYFNSAANPILYNLISSKFRSAFYKAIKLRPLSSISKRSHTIVSERMSTTLVHVGGANGGGTAATMVINGDEHCAVLRTGSLGPPTHDKMIVRSHSLRSVRTTSL